MAILHDDKSCVQALVDEIRDKRVYLWIMGDLLEPGEVRLAEKVKNLILPLIQIPIWEVWTDIPDPSLSTLIEENQNEHAGWPVSHRQSLPIAGEPEELLTGAFSHDQLLPIFFLRGILDDEEHPFVDSPATRRRQRIARDHMLSRLADITRGVLILIGGNEAQVWKETLDEIFDDLLPDIQGIKIILVSSKEFPANMEWVPSTASQRSQAVYAWTKGSDALVHAVKEVLLTSGRVGDKDRIKIGEQCVGIDDILIGPVSRIDESFVIIEEDCLEHEAKSPEDYDSLLQDFLSRPEPLWEGFAAGFAFPRHYRPFRYDGGEKPSFISGDDFKKWRNFDLNELVLTSLKTCEELDGAKNITITVPAVRGAGATTLIWNAAYNAARAGYPSMVLKSLARELDFLSISSFLTDLSRRARGADTNEKPDAKTERYKEKPALLVFDVEHEDISEISNLAVQLRNDGRSCVVLRAITHVEDRATNSWNPPRLSPNVFELLSATNLRGNALMCAPLLPLIEASEVESIQKHFEGLKKRYGLALNIPALEEWRAYQEESKIAIPGSPTKSKKSKQPNAKEETDEYLEAQNLFWVCLHFFLFQYMQGKGVTDRVRNGMYAALDGLNNDIASYVYSVAVSTFFRLAIPARVLASAYGALSWVEMCETIRTSSAGLQLLLQEREDREVFLFIRHPQLAFLIMEHLRRAAKRSPEFLIVPRQPHYPVEWLWHILEKLKPGEQVHRQYARAIGNRVLKLEKGKLSIYVADILIDSFRKFPRGFIDQDPTLLQSYAITLSKSASVDPDSPSLRFQQAENLMKRALELVGTDMGPTEDPRVLKTTLANIYEAWSRKEPDETRSGQLLTQAAEFYREVLKDWPDSPYTRYGYAKLLFSEYNQINDPPTKVEKLQQAIDLLDAEPEPAFKQEWEDFRMQLLRESGSESVSQHIAQLKAAGYEVGYILEARLRLAEDNWSNQAIERAIELLDEAAGAPSHCPDQTQRILLMYRCWTAHPEKKWDYEKRYALISSLKLYGHHLSPRLQYEFAVLCYHMQQEDQGEQTFSALRRSQRYLRVDLDEPEYWHEKVSGRIPPALRRMVMRVARQESPFRGWARVQGLRKLVPFTPVHWKGRLNLNSPVPCVIRFNPSGPMAVPEKMHREHDGSSPSGSEHKHATGR